ncbi:Zinc finger protein 749 [Harpegnathos saltator]|uniref:Zinc finger protein 749 n=1 Tax=Harpegnathos saltator TaxID=610380 RepID=E2C173_HARSA|nr:Zinc finger protein 749 [Harpegnathos saltator]
MDMTKRHLDEVERGTNKSSSCNYERSDMDGILLKSRIQYLQPNKQERTNIMQPGPYLKNNLCGKNSTEESSTKKYFKISKQCKICKQYFHEIYELYDHYEKDHKYHFYKCKYCNFKTKYKTNLKRHEGAHIKKPSNGNYKCTEPGCNKIYKDKYALMMHMTRNHKNKMESNTMELGPSSESNLYGKLFSRTKNEKHKVSRECRICGQIFRNKSMLIDHSATVHHHCVHICEDKTCNYETNSLQNMQKHFLIKHMNNEN